MHTLEIIQIVLEFLSLTIQNLILYIKIHFHLVLPTEILVLIWMSFTIFNLL